MKRNIKRTNNRDSVRRILSVYFIFSFIAMGGVFSQNSVLVKAQKAYSLMQYDVASKLYENYFQNTGERTNPEILAELADSYWKMRNYSNAKKVYEEINLLDPAKISEQDRLKLSNLEARDGNYQNAAKWLDGAEGFGARQKNFTDNEVINAASAESEDWSVHLLNINTKYREFSPVIVNDYLYFTSNSAQDKVVKANGWDGDNFTKLWKAKISDIKSVENNDKVVSHGDSTVGAHLKSKKLAGVFEDSDTKPIERKASGIANFINNLPAISPELAMMVKGLEGVNYNVASASVDENNNFYFSGNKKIEKGEDTSKLMIYQGKLNDDKVSDVFPLDIRGAQLDNLIHPAISKDGTKLVFAGNAEGGTYDLYLLERGSASSAWSDPIKLSGSINTPGNEVFPTIDENGILYFSSDGHPG